MKGANEVICALFGRRRVRAALAVWVVPTSPANATGVAFDLMRNVDTVNAEHHERAETPILLSLEAERLVTSAVLVDPESCTASPK